METGIAAITEKLYIPKFADNVYNSTALLNKLKAGEKEYDGGTKIK